MRKGILDIYFENERNYLGKEQDSMNFDLYNMNLPNLAHKISVPSMF